MQDYFERYRKAWALNEQLIAATVECWTAWSYPAIHFAKYL
ncbi:MAG TPA: hypothetical protein VIM12_06065 [Noviherbaspirillum sp.]|jgi:hypothetical protein